MSDGLWSSIVSVSRRVLLPLVWYYVVTVAIPIGNGASLSDAVFVKHALIVLVLPVMLIALACTARALGRAVVRSVRLSAGLRCGQRARASVVTISYWNRTKRYSSLSSSRS